MKIDRRRGGLNSETRMRLIKAASRLMAEQGVASITARRLARDVCLSHQIVHYYFKTMDDLLVAIIEDGMGVALLELGQATSSENPLAVVTKLNGSLLAFIMGTELTIYSKDKPAIREAIGSAITRYREAQTALFTRHLELRGIKDTAPPIVATIIITSVLQTFTLEKAIGIADGHQETIAWLARVFGAPELEQFD